MGKISTIKTINEEKVTVTLELNQKELLWLKGNIENVHIFAEKNLTCPSRLVQRGKRESTKYFLLPREYREGVLPSTKVKCNRIDTNTKVIFIFEVPKY